MSDVSTSVIKGKPKTKIQMNLKIEAKPQLNLKLMFKTKPVINFKMNPKTEIKTQVKNQLKSQHKPQLTLNPVKQKLNLSIKPKSKSKSKSNDHENQQDRHHEDQENYSLDHSILSNNVPEISDTYILPIYGVNLRMTKDNRRIYDLECTRLIGTIEDNNDIIWNQD